VPPTDLDDGRHVQCVDGLSDVGERKARRVRIPVHGDNRRAQLLQSRERTTLVPPGPDEEHRRALTDLISAANQV
jgi:hypothetical protein